MSLADIVSLAGKIAGVPGMDLAVSAAIDLIQTAQNVKVYKSQCQNLSFRCANLLLSYHDKCRGLEGTDLMESVDEITAVIERAQKKANSWTSMSWPKSFVHQGDIKQSLDLLNHDIDLCGQKFNIASGADLRRGNLELQAMHERDNAEQRDMLQRVLRAVDDLRDTLVNEPSAAEPIMQAIQEELQQGSVAPEEQRDLQQGMYNIHRQTAHLPPLIDLTGQVEKTSGVIVYGAYNDVYKGIWLGEEEVALKFARAINHTPKARKRFEQEVEIWRNLQHRHVDRLYGIVYFNSHIYTVSPWMNNGNALNYINSIEEVVDRLTIIGDVASGMEYLHTRHVVHGDLRAANVLIGNDGKACVADFGLSKVIEEEIQEEISSSTHSSERPIRWQAPELVDADAGFVPMSTRTDVWSYGMLCLEILTGRKPYIHRTRDAHVIQDLVAYRLPARPTDEDVISRGLSDQLWQVMLACWNREPQDRPKMANVKRVVRGLQSAAPPAEPILNRPLTQSPGRITKELPGTIAIRRDSNNKPSPQSAPSLLPPPSLTPGASGRKTTSATLGHSRSTSSGSSLIGVLSTPDSQLQDIPMGTYQASSEGGSSPSPVLAPTPNTGGSLDIFFDSPPAAAEDTLARSQSFVARIIQPSRAGSTTESSPSGLSRTRPPHQSSSYVNMPGDCVDGDGRRSGQVSASEDIDEGIARSYSPGMAPLALQDVERRPSLSPLSTTYPSSLSSSRLNRRSSSLLTDPIEPSHTGAILHASKSGKVKAGNLEGLVERLVKAGSYAKDEEFQEVFLTTHRLFTSTRVILGLLVGLFNSNLDWHKERVERRVRVLNVIQRLLKGHYTKTIEVPLLEDLKSFCQEVTDPLAAVAGDIIQTIDKLISASHGIGDAPPITPASITRRSSRASEVTPRALAVALTILEGEYYNAITPTDCVSDLLEKGNGDVSGTNQIAEARATHNKIVNWVKASTIKSRKKEHRADALRLFVRTAIECRNIHNYSSTFALVAAIDSQTVDRLGQTKKALRKDLSDARRSLSSLFDVSHNHRAYRLALPKPTEGMCLPWLAVHLKDLRGICERHESRIVVDGETLINFEKFASIYDGIQEILAFQSERGGSGFTSKERRLPDLLYLEDQLAKTQLGQAFEDKMEKDSLELKRLEDLELEDERRRLVESTGFKAA